MFQSTKLIELGSTAFRQPFAKSHCKFIHGYRLNAKLWFVSNELDNNNWVVDFGALDSLKEVLQSVFDHKLVVASNDPQLEDFKKLADVGAVDLMILDKGVGIERFAEFVWETTNAQLSENDDYKSRGVRCVKVEVFEHEKNSAIYNHDSHTDNVDKVYYEQNAEAVSLPTIQNNNAAPLYNHRGDQSGKGGPAPLRSPRDESIADILTK